MRTLFRMKAMDIPEGRLAADFAAVRRSGPLVHNITNYVAMNYSANVLYALGARPLMSSETSEMEEIVDASDALVINVGCIGRSQFEAMLSAAGRARATGRPWVLDPAGVGLSAFRTDACHELVGDFAPAVIRGNAAEISALAGVPARQRGMDSPETPADGIESAMRLSARTGAVVCMSGAVDCITDGRRLVRIADGSPLMGRVTAMGCSASAAIAAFLAVESDALAAAACAMGVMGLAGRKAEAVSAGPGSFAVNFLDALSNLDPAETERELRYE